jgi:hypothetical protein
MWPSSFKTKGEVTTMKINGAKLSGVNTKVVVFPRQDKDIVFKVSAVLNYEDFDKIFPMPTAPTMVRPGGEKSQDVEDPEFKKAQNTWASARGSWMAIQSMLATEGLEFETVDLGDPTTWLNWAKEFIESGFTTAEISRLLSAITEVNGLNEEAIEAATKRFLAGPGLTLLEE